MEEVKTSTDAMGNAAPGGATPTGSPPKQQSPIDQAKGAARKVLALITGRTKG